MARPHHPTRTPQDRAGAGSGTLWLHGRHAVAAALANPARRCRRLIGLPETAKELETLRANALAAHPPAPEIVDRRALEALLPVGAVHQGLALETYPLPEPSLDEVIAALPEGGAPHIVVLLDQVSDPHNVGAILRSAAAFAALAVVVPEHGAPSITGTLAKAASGALEVVPLIRVTNLVRALEGLKAQGFWCLGLAGEAKQSLSEIDLPERLALVLGGEGSGLRRLTREHCDFLVRLPTRGALSALNVSNAAAVALYALTSRGPRG